jgi:hypothetical protein
MEKKHSMEVQILLNLKNEIHNLNNSDKESLLRKWFKEKNIDSPIDSKTTFKHNIRFLGKEENPKYSGYGIIIYPSPEEFSKCYIGHFDKGKRDGKGCRLLNNTIFEGTYKSDLKSGPAKIWKIEDKSLELIFKGQYKNGKMHGNCLVQDEQHKFEGNIDQGLYHGFCKIWYTNGDSFQGTMVKGEMSGTGKITYANGDFYEGGLFKNMRIGKGNYYFNQSNRNVNLSSNISISDLSEIEDKGKDSEINRQLNKRNKR